LRGLRGRRREGFRGGGSGKGRESGGGSSSGALIRCLLTGPSSHHHGKSPVGALLSAGAVKQRGLCSATITATRKGQKAGPGGFI